MDATTSIAPRMTANKATFIIARSPIEREAEKQHPAENVNKFVLLNATASKAALLAFPPDSLFA